MSRIEEILDTKSRPRRLRANSNLRAMVRETRMSKSSLIYPVFVRDGQNIKEEIGAMPGQYRYSVDRLAELCEETLAAGVTSLMLFGIPEQKDACGAQAYAENGVVQRALREIKSRYPELYLVGDVCMCEYTDHGHCGILRGHEVDNDASLEYLAKIALAQAAAGADMVAPSDMMDFRVAAIRAALDGAGYQNLPIMAYSAKFSSAFYGPFREAAGSAPAFGDRKSYQMDWHNGREAMREVAADYDEGADILMVKPALAYLDIIRQAKDNFDRPIAAYSVSGEYSMIKAAAAAGFVQEEALIAETATSIFRAGADILLSYFAKEIAHLIDKGIIG